MGNEVSNESNENISASPEAEEFENYMKQMDLSSTERFAKIFSKINDKNTEITGNLYKETKKSRRIIRKVLENARSQSIIMAIIMRDINMIGDIVNGGFDLENTDEGGKTPIERCRETGWDEGEQIILQIIADPRYCHHKGAKN